MWTYESTASVSESNDPVQRIDTKDVPESNGEIRSRCTADGCHWGGTSSDPTRHVEAWNGHAKQVMELLTDDEAAKHRIEFVEETDDGV